MQTNQIFKFKTLFLMGCIAALFSACTLDPCEDVICQNDGVCVDGDCDCPDGFTGTTCEFTLAEAVAGSYEVLNSCVSGDSYTSVIEVDPDFPDQNNRIRIYNPRNAGEAFFYPATITSDSEINIPIFNLDLGTGTIQGSGAGDIRTDGSLELNVNYDGEDCIEVYTP